MNNWLSSTHFVTQQTILRYSETEHPKYRTNVSTNISAEDSSSLARRLVDYSSETFIEEIVYNELCTDASDPTGFQVCYFRDAEWRMHSLQLWFIEIRLAGQVRLLVSFVRLHLWLLSHFEFTPLRYKIN